MDQTDDAPADREVTVGGVSLAGYVEICQVLVRTAGGSARRIDDVLGSYDLTPDRWALVKAAWSEQMRRDAALRDEFRRRYAAPSAEPAPANE